MKLLIITASFFIFTASWREFQTYDGKFRVLTPTGDMTEKVSKIKTAIGELNYHSYIHRPEEKNPDCVFYIVNYCDYPSGTFPADSTELIQEFFTQTIDESVKSVHGLLTYQADIQDNIHKGKIWRVQYNQGKAFIKSKCYMAGDRFYLVQTMMLKEKSMNPSADKFLDSFHIF